MKHVFLSPGGGLRERWRRAFPDAVAVVTVESINSSASGADVVWLDASQLGPSRAGPYLQAAVSAGHRVVVMSATPSEVDAFEALREGAVGYCHVDAASEQIREIGIVVEHGGLWMPPSLVQRLIALSVNTLPQSSGLATPELGSLTPRERMVAREVARGESNREIADTLDITERTVKAHLSSIFEKLGARDRVQLALIIGRALELEASH